MLLKVFELRPRTDFQKKRGLIRVKKHFDITVNQGLFVFAHSVQDASLAMTENADIRIFRREFNFVRFARTALGK
jgi:hypothetical protein